MTGVIWGLEANESSWITDKINDHFPSKPLMTERAQQTQKHTRKSEVQIGLEGDCCVYEELAAGVKWGVWFNQGNVWQMNKYICLIASVDISLTWPSWLSLCSSGCLSVLATRICIFGHSKSWIPHFFHNSFTMARVTCTCVMIQLMKSCVLEF